MSHDLVSDPGHRGRTRWWIWALGALGLLVVALSIWAYARKKAPAEAAPSKRDVPYLDGKWIRYSPQFGERAKITFATVEQAPLAPVITVTGTVAFDPRSVAGVGSRIPGRIRRIAKFLGDTVKAGDVLAELESADLGEAQAALLIARANLDAAVANEKRETQLAAARVSAERDAELARATAASARAQLRAAEQRIGALGAARSGGAGILFLTSPIDGRVIENHVIQGQAVDANVMAFRVADLRHVWIELSVFEREVARLHPRDRADISPQTNLSLTFQGEIEHIGDVIDRETRSAPVIIRADNTSAGLRPGQSVLAKIHLVGTGQTVLRLPTDALTSVDGKPTVFVTHDATSVEVRVVTIGSRDSAHVEITSGLQAGEQVVATGVFALKSEVFR